MVEAIDLEAWYAKERAALEEENASASSEKKKKQRTVIRQPIVEELPRTKRGKSKDTKTASDSVQRTTTTTTSSKLSLIHI